MFATMSERTQWVLPMSHEPMSPDVLFFQCTIWSKYHKYLPTGDQTTPPSVISFSAGSYVDGHVAFCPRLEIGSWGLYLPRISDRPLYGFLLEICLPPPWLQRHVLQTCFPRFVDRTSLAIFLCNWSTSRSIDQLWQGAICTTVQIFHKLHLSWRRPQKCLPSIWKELARTLISALTGNPNGRVLFLASINRAPLTSFDVGGHLARRGLLWSLLRLIRGPGNHIITHWPTSQAPFSLKRERNLAQLGRYYAPNITPS